LPPGATCARQVKRARSALLRSGSSARTTRAPSAASRLAQAAVAMLPARSTTTNPASAPVLPAMIRQPCRAAGAAKRLEPGQLAAVDERQDLVRAVGIGIMRISRYRASTLASVDSPIAPSTFIDCQHRLAARILRVALGHGGGAVAAWPWSISDSACQHSRRLVVIAVAMSERFLLHEL
jgi:hypothetical protein